jgi:hypothetical protein
VPQNRTVCHRWRVMGYVMLLMFCLASSVSGQESVPWYRRSLVGMEIGPTGAQFGSDPRDTGYAARFDGREIVRRCREAHAEYVVIWARDGEYAYYNSKVMPKCPGLGDRDVLRETVEEARKVKMPVIAYCVVQYPTQAMRAHPEYRRRGRQADGASLL